MDQKPIRMVQLSDLHIFTHREQSLLGVKTQESFEAVVQLLKEKEANKTDLMVLSGDLSQDGSPTSYQYIADKLAAFHIPIYAIPGNHDHIPTLKACYQSGPIVCQSIVSLANWQLVMLNSQKTGAVGGELSAHELQLLADALNTNKHTIICLHHHPLAVGSEWVDKLGLSNASSFCSIINQKNLKAIIFGHVHQASEQLNHQQVPCISAPSTCFQFKPYQANFALHNMPPGYRWFELYPNGQFKTGVERVNHYIGHYLEDAKGY